MSTSSGKSPAICLQCSKSITGEFISANKGHYHLECFRCLDCQKQVQDKFFPLKDDNNKIRLFCETDYFKRLDLLCAKCNQALRGPHINALGKKYHLDHFTCSVCPKVFRQHDKYFEISDKVYCQDHYSLLFAAKCGGCQTAVLKNFVEMNKDSVIEQWHPECYMIFKLWNVKIGSTKHIRADLDTDDGVSRQFTTVDKVARILHVLSAFEESSAECIQQMLIDFSNQNYQHGVIQAEKFICHIEALFLALDKIEAKLSQFQDGIGMNLGKEPKHLAKKIVAFFTRLSQGREASHRTESTKQLIDLVTNLARELKGLIRCALKGALKLERVHQDSVATETFLAVLITLGESKSQDESCHIYEMKREDLNIDLCIGCKKPVEEANIGFRNYHWHNTCFRCLKCNRELLGELDSSEFDTSLNHILCKEHRSDVSLCGFEIISQLQQYVFLLRCALKRLCLQLNVKIDSNAVSDSAMVSEKIRKSNEALATLDEVKAGPKQSEIIKPAALESSSPSSISPVILLEPMNLSTDNRLDAASSIPEFRRESSNSVKIPTQNEGPSRPHQNTSIPGDSDPNLQGPESPRIDLLSPSNQGSVRNFLGKRLVLSELGPLEQLVVRQLASLKLQTLMEKFISYEELVEMTELGKRGVWEKFLGAFKPGKKIAKEGTFGVPLDVLVERAGIDTDLAPHGLGSTRIPAIIDSCIKTLQSMDLSAEGIFRKNGNIKRLKTVTDNLDRDPFTFDFKDDNPIQVAALMKKFLREMPDPLLTFRLHKLFVTSQQLLDEASKKEALHYICCLLPKANLDLLEILFWFMGLVASYATKACSNPTTDSSVESGGNKMDLENLAVVLAPNILMSKSKNVLDDESFLAIHAVEMLLRYHNEFWLVPESILSSLDDPDYDKDKERRILKKYEDVVDNINVRKASNSARVDVVDGRSATIERFEYSQTPNKSENHIMTFAD